MQGAIPSKELAPTLMGKTPSCVITDKYIGSLREHLTDREHQKKTFTQHQSYKKRAQNTPPKRFKPKLHKHNPLQPHLSPTH
jgi:hypothetical protein